MHFTLKDLEELEDPTMGGGQFEIAINDAFPRIAEELRRLWNLENPLPTQEEEKEFYHRAYHVCHTGCPLPCPNRN